MFGIIEADAVREICNISVAKAAEALEEMTGAKVDIDVLDVGLAEPEDVNDFGMDENVICVATAVEGDYLGVSLLFLPVGDGFAFCDLLLGNPVGTTKSMGRDEREALIEAGNVMVGAFVSAMGDMLDVELLTGIPALACDVAGAITTSALAEHNCLDCGILVVKSLLTSEYITARFVLSLQQESMRKAAQKAKTTLNSFDRTEIKGGAVQLTSTVKVMVVDDTNYTRKMIKSAFAGTRFEAVAEASNGRDAVEMYKRFRPDLVTMDIIMPEVDGISALRTIKEFDPGAKVIVCSALGQERKIEEALQAGAVDFLVKPFKTEKLIKALEKAAKREC